MKRNLMLILAVGLCLIVCACDPDYSPKVAVNHMSPGESRTFSAYGNDLDNTMVWYLDGEVVAEDTNIFVFTAEDIGDEEMVTHTLLVREENKKDNRLYNLFGVTQQCWRCVSVQWMINIMEETQD